MESKAKSFAHLIVARHHLIAGRYVLMLSAIKKAWGIHPYSFNFFATNDSAVKKWYSFQDKTSNIGNKKLRYIKLNE